MHELSIALSLLDAAEEGARGHDGRVAAIHLKLGLNSGVVREALTLAYEMAREGTPFEHTELLVEEVAAIGYCPACAADQFLTSLLICPVCGGPTSELRSGRELEVVALEIVP